MKPKGLSTWGIVWRVGIILLMAWFSWLMLQLSLPYIAFKPGIAFLRSKQNVYHIDYWRYGFYAHVFTSIFLLVGGFIQFSNYFIRRQPLLHRRVGMAYLIILVFFSGPGAFAMALHANFGFAAQVSFVLQTLLWYVFSLAAYYYVRRKNYMQHGEMMLRSYALTLAAITLRILVFFLTLAKFKGVRPGEIYIAVAWLSWVLNLLLAELAIRLGFIRWVFRKT